LEVDLQRDVHTSEIGRLAHRFDLFLESDVERAQAALVVGDGVREQRARSGLSDHRRDQRPTDARSPNKKRRNTNATSVAKAMISRRPTFSIKSDASRRPCALSPAYPAVAKNMAANAPPRTAAAKYQSKPSSSIVPSRDFGAQNADTTANR